MQVDATLAGNLQELYALEKTDKSKAHQMLPGLFGKSIYYSKTGWGRILKIIYAVWKYFFGPDLMIKKMQRAIEYTESTYRLQHQEAIQYFRGYEKQFIAFLEEAKSFDANAYEKDRWSITQWSDLAVPFTKFVKSNTPKKISHLFKRYTGKAFNHKKSPFYNEKIPESMSRHQQLINLTRKIPVETPLRALRKLSQKKIISDKEERMLKAWVNSVNVNYSKISIKKFHESLDMFVKHILDKHWTKYMTKPLLEELELELIKRGLTLFQKKDEEHLKWVNSLKEGDILKHRNRKYHLGKEIKTIKANNRSRVYTLTNTPHKLVVIGQNKGILNIRRRASLDYSWGIRPMIWHCVSSDGNFGVVETLSEAVADHQWKSKDFLHIDDLLFLKPIIEQIKWFIEQKQTPKNLDVSFLRYDRSHILKSTKPLLKDEFNYALLIDFCKQCANNHPFIYKFLIKETGLSESTYHDYFHEVAVNTLNAENDKPEDIAAMHKYQIINYSIIKAAKKLKKEITVMQAKCMKKIISEYEVENPMPISIEVAREIYRHYKGNQSICFIWPETKGKVIETVAKKLKLQPIK